MGLGSPCKSSAGDAELDCNDVSPDSLEVVAHVAIRRPTAYRFQ